jgi:hypothetical protein
MAGAKRDWPQTLLRLRPDLKAWLKEQASRNYSSINSEILRCVEERMDKTAALDARRKAATGEVSQATPTAAVRSKGALQGTSHLTQALELPR